MKAYESNPNHVPTLLYLANHLFDQYIHLYPEIALKDSTSTALLMKDIFEQYSSIPYVNDIYIVYPDINI